MAQTSELIMAFDPGGTTGYVCHHLKQPGKQLESGGSTFDYVATWSGGQLGPHEHFKELWQLLTYESPSTIVCEDFRIFKDEDSNGERGGVSLISRDYIGVIKLYRDLTGTPVIFQPSNLITLPWLSNEALKKIGVYVDGYVNRHQNDAARHMLYYAIQTRGRKDILNALRRRYKGKSW